MNPNSPRTPSEELEARLTALLFSELSAEEAAAWQAAIATNPELAKVHDRLKHAIDLVREAVTSPSETATTHVEPLKLSEERRQKLLAHFKTIKPKELARSARSFRQLRLLEVAAVLAIAALLAGLFLPALSKAKSKAQRVAILNELRQLDSAKQQWALENNKSAAEVPTVPPLVAGRSYSLNRVGEPVAADVGAAQAKELLSRVRSGQPSNASPGQEVRLAADGNVFAEGTVAQAKATDLSKRELEEVTRKPAIVVSTTPRNIAKQVQIILPPVNPPARSSDGFGGGGVVTVGAGGDGTGGKDATISDPKFPGVWEKASAKQFVNTATSAAGASENLPRQNAGLAPNDLAFTKHADRLRDGEGEWRLARSRAVATNGTKEKLNESAVNSTTELAANTPADAGIASAPPVDATTGLPVVINGRLSSKGSDVALSFADGYKVPVPGDLPLARRFFRSESAPSETADRGQGFFTSTQQSAQLHSPLIANSDVVPKSFGVQPSPGKLAFSLFGPWRDFDNDGNVDLFAGALELNPTTLYRNAGDAGFSVPAPPTDSRPDFARKRELAELENKPAWYVRDEDRLIRRTATNAPIPQPEVQTSENHFSTFSLNVSDVSFKLAMASLAQGQMPDVASIRSEEFINAFNYRDPEPQSGAPIAFAYERARYPFAHNRDLLRFSLKTAAAGRQSGRAMNIVLLLDNSGSMERADRVQIIREALRVLATQLQPQDKLSVITFARTARLVADGISGDKANEVTEQVAGLTPEGGTNLEDAMNLAYQTAAKHYLTSGINRVVLLTDGAANLGDVEPESLKQKVEAQRKQGIALDCFGIGWEGLNDDLLEVLSRNGDGRYGFINSPEEAATDFVGQLAGALKIAASDVKVQVEFNPKRVTSYRQIGYAKHQLTKEQFRDNTVDAAEIAAQEAGNALYTVEVNPAGQGPLATVRVRYKVPGTTDYREQAWDVPFTGNALSLEQSSPAMRLAASASAFSEWLVASPFAGEITHDRLLSVLSGVPDVYGSDARPKKLEWMIRQAKSLEGK